MATGSGGGLWHRPHVLLTLTVLFWAGNFVLGRAVHLDVPPVGLAFWRWFGGFLIVLPFAWRHVVRDWPVVVEHWRIVLVLSALGIAAFNTLVYIGLHDTTAINALLMQSTMPVVIVVIAFAAYRETLTARQALGVAVSLSGAVAIIVRGEMETLLGFALNPGDGWVVAAVVCYAAYSVLLRERPALHPLSFLAVIFLVGALMLLPFWVWEWTAGAPMRVDRVTVLAVGYVAVFPSILAYLCYNRAVELVGASRAGLFFHLMPVFGSLMAVAFLGERFQGFHAVGMGLILGGIFLATRR